MDSIYNNAGCPFEDCPNRGFLALDANFLFYIIEGTIKYVQDSYPDLTTHSDRVETILLELRNILGLISNCCSSGEQLHISDRILNEEVLSVIPEDKDLIQLSRYTHAQRSRILRAVREFLPNPIVVNDIEVEDLRNVFQDPDINPDEYDATLIISACRLSNSESRAIIITSDPDFSDPITILMQLEEVILGGNTYQTTNLSSRDFFRFLIQIHDCCTLSSDRYSPLIEAFFGAHLRRLPRLNHDNVHTRTIGELDSFFQINNESLRLKNT